MPLSKKVIARSTRHGGILIYEPDKGGFCFSRDGYYPTATADSLDAAKQMIDQQTKLLTSIVCAVSVRAKSLANIAIVANASEKDTRNALEFLCRQKRVVLSSSGKYLAK
jgi:hypothetical protein